MTETNPTALEQVRARYRMGMCDVLALAVHQHTGWPLALWSGEFEDDMGEPGDVYTQPQHAVVVDPDSGSWFDIDGLHPAAEQPSLFFDAPPLKILLVPASPEEVAEAFTTQDIEPAQLQRALSDLESLGLLATLPARRRRLSP